MRLAFRRHRDGHNHTEIVFSDGTWASSVPGRGVRRGGEGFPGEYDFIPLPVKLEQEIACRAWFLSHENDGYDWAAKLTGVDRENREYCTEACILALNAAGLLADMVAHKTDSDGLYERAKGQFNKIESEE